MLTVRIPDALRDRIDAVRPSTTSREAWVRAACERALEADPMARKNFNDLRADLTDRVGEERVAATEQAERERYELEQKATHWEPAPTPAIDRNTLAMERMRKSVYKGSGK